MQNATLKWRKRFKYLMQMAHNKLIKRKQLSIGNLISARYLPKNSSIKSILIMTVKYHWMNLRDSGGSLRDQVTGKMK